MKLFYNNIFIFIILILYSSEDEKITVTVIATSGIVDKVENSKSKIISFNIPCQVDKNITNKISRIDLTLNTKRPEDNKIFPAECNIQSVRIESEDTLADTKLICILNYTNYIDDNIDDDMNLVIEGAPIYTSNIVEFIFEKFSEIGTFIQIDNLFIYKLDDSSCMDNNYQFEMNFTGTITAPLKSTVCVFDISDNEIHTTAKCAIPISSNVIKCYIDTSDEKIQKGEKIEIKAQNYVKCENGQIIKIVNNAENILEIEEDCKKCFLYYNNIFYFLIFLLFII
jgi:hypothetical protein